MGGTPIRQHPAYFLDNVQLNGNRANEGGNYVDAKRVAQEYLCHQEREGSVLSQPQHPT
jgi:hypothetical protein